MRNDDIPSTSGIDSSTSSCKHEQFELARYAVSISGAWAPGMDLGSGTRNATKLACLSGETTDVQQKASVDVMKSNLKVNVI